MLDFQPEEPAIAGAYNIQCWLAVGRAVDLLSYNVRQFVVLSEYCLGQRRL